VSKRSSAKYKLDRRMGENVFGRPKSPVNRREYGPGQHGQRRKSKVSDFGIQLRAKQKLKGYYGDVTEKQFKRTYQEASAMKGDASQNLIGLLERRLDMVVYRAKFAPTIWAAIGTIATAAMKNSTGAETWARCSRATVSGMNNNSQFIGLRRQMLSGERCLGDPTSVSSETA